MKKLLLSALLFAGCLAHGAWVSFQFYRSDGTADTNVIRVIPTANPVANADGSFTTGGLAYRITPNTNGYALAQLAQNTYIVTNAALGLGYAIRVPLDSGSNIYNATFPFWASTNGLSLSGFDYYVNITYGSNPPPTLNALTNAFGFFPANPVDVTNESLLMFGVGSNFSLTIGAADTNFTRATATVLTNDITASSNAAVLAASTISSNFTILTGGSLSNLVAGVAAGSTNYGNAVSNSVYFAADNSASNRIQVFATTETNRTSLMSNSLVLTIQASNTANLATTTNLATTVSNGAVASASALAIVQGAANTNDSAARVLAAFLSLSNFSLTVGGGGSNATSLQGSWNTNDTIARVLAQGASSTNFTLAMGSALSNDITQTSNLVFTAASAAGTNVATAQAAGSTNFARQTGTDLTNLITLTASIVSSNATNEAVLAAWNQSLNSTNFTMLVSNLAVFLGISNATVLVNSYSNYVGATFANRTNLNLVGSLSIGNFPMLTNSTMVLGVYGTGVGMGGTYPRLNGTANYWTNYGTPFFAWSNGVSSFLVSNWNNSGATWFTTTGGPESTNWTPNISASAAGMKSYFSGTNNVNEVFFGWPYWPEFNAYMSYMSNYFATNFVSGPVQASNIVGSITAVLSFTNGLNGQVFESDGTGGWLWTNIVPISVLASNIAGPALGQVSNIVAGAAGGSGKSNYIYNINGVGSNSALYTPTLYGGQLGRTFNGGAQNLTNLNALVIGGPQVAGIFIGSEQNGGSGHGGIEIEWQNGGQMYGETFDTVVGGATNDIAALTEGASIFGGENNYIGTGASGGANFSTIIGGLSNNIAASIWYCFASGWQAKISHGGTWMWSDFEPGVGQFTDTGTNQFLIRAAGGVGINTNNPTGFALNVSGNANVSGNIYANGSLVGLAGGATNLTPWSSDINGASYNLTNVNTIKTASLFIGGTNVYSIVTGNASGAIANNNGTGTNTTLLIPTLQFNQTNVIYFPYATITITGLSNAPANGTYVADQDTNSTFYAWWTSFYSQQPAGIWTNTAIAGTNWAVLWMPGYSGVGWTPLLPYFLNSPTNNLIGPTPFASGSPQGAWTYNNGSYYPGIATGSTTTNTTTLSPIAFVSAGQFQPLTHAWFFDSYNTGYSFSHGLGHVPHLVQWFLLCIQHDPGTGMYPGDTMDIEDIMATWTLGWSRVKNTNSLTMNFPEPLVGNEAQYIVRTNGYQYPYVQNHVSSFTNFQLYVEYYP